MYLYAARLRAKRGMGSETMAYLVRARDLVSSIAGLPFWAWAVAAGDDLGTYVLSARVDSIEQYMNAFGTVNQSADYQELTKKSIDLLEGPTDTVFNQVVAVAGDVGGPPKPLIVATTVTMTPGRQGATIPWAVNLLNHVVDTTGGGGMFATSMVGATSDISWIQGFDTAGQIDEMNAKIQNDAGYLELLRQGGELFVAGSGRRIVMAQMP